MGAEAYSRTLDHATLTGAVRLFEPDPNMVGKRIFRPKPVMGQSVTVDVIINPRHMARYRHNEAAYGKQKNQSVRKDTITLPTIREMTTITGATLQTLRTPGTAHEPWRRQKVGDELKALDIVVENRREVTRWAILQAGKLEYADTDVDGVTFTVDFSIDATHTPTLAGTDKWSDATNSDPLGDIDDWKVLYARDSGKPPRYLFLTTTVMGYLRNSAKVQAMLGDRMKDDIFLLGRLREISELEIVVYDLGYVPVGGSFTNYLGTDKVVLWSGDEYPEYEGVAADPKASTPGKFSKSWEDENPPGVNLSVEVCAFPSGERVKELFCADVA